MRFVIRHQQSSTEGLTPNTWKKSPVTQSPLKRRISLPRPIYLGSRSKQIRPRRPAAGLGFAATAVASLSILLIDTHALMFGVCDANFGELLGLHGSCAIEPHRTT